MATNKVVYGNQTLIDLTGDTATADKILRGYTAHDRTGSSVTGTAGATVTNKLLKFPSSMGSVSNQSLNLI